MSCRLIGVGLNHALGEPASNSDISPTDNVLPQSAVAAAACLPPLVLTVPDQGFSHTADGA